MSFKGNKLIASIVWISLLFAGNPGQLLAADAELEFKKAMQARDSGELDDSIAIFEAILSQEPALHRARLELAVAYYRSTRYEEAKRQATKVLDDPETPASVRLSIIAFLAQIKSDEKRFKTVKHTFRPSASVGFLHDTNVNVGPGSDVVNIGAATLRLVAGSTPQSDNAITLTAGINHSYQTGKVLNIGAKSAALFWQSQAAIYTKQYRDLSEFNLDVVSLSTGPALIVPKHWRSNFSLRLDNIELGSDRLAVFASVLPSLTLQLGNTTELTFEASLADRDYKQSGDEGRDSVYRSLGIRAGKRFANDKVTLQGGVSVFDENADDDRFSRDGTRIFVGASWKAWDKGAVYANFSQRNYEHDAPEPLFNEARDEREQRFVLGVRHEFTNDYLNKWVVNGSYKYTDSSSNVDIFTYDREVVGATLSRSF